MGKGTSTEAVGHILPPLGGLHPLAFPPEEADDSIESAKYNRACSTLENGVSFAVY
jgi:hypothetical protein